MMLPDFRELQAFLTLVRTGSFSAAAKKIGITQPAVSAQIAKLEQIVGYPLFLRCPEGTLITDQGKALIPIAGEIENDYHNLLRRAAYWKRSQTKQVKICIGGDRISQEARVTAHAGGGSRETGIWTDLEPDGDWIAALKNYEVDVVVAGSYMKTADVPGIRTHIVAQEDGITLAWNPVYYPFQQEPHNFPEAVSSTLILPSPSLVMGFREFLTDWCESAYGIQLHGFIECRTEADAVDACKLGLGVLVFPGNAAARMQLPAAGLAVHHAFVFALPNAFTFGVRCRGDEQNPQILNAAEHLKRDLSAKNRPDRS